jgi:hypothetical protein
MLSSQKPPRLRDPIEVKIVPNAEDSRVRAAAARYAELQTYWESLDERERRARDYMRATGPTVIREKPNTSRKVYAWEPKTLLEAKQKPNQDLVSRALDQIRRGRHTPAIDPGAELQAIEFDRRKTLPELEAAKAELRDAQGAAAFEASEQLYPLVNDALRAIDFHFAGLYEACEVYRSAVAVLGANGHKPSSVTFKVALPVAAITPGNPENMASLASQFRRALNGMVPRFAEKSE